MEIDERLLNDSEAIVSMDLCELRLIKDGEVDWFLLIPLRENMIDWSDLTLEDQMTLSYEITLVSRKLKEMEVDKINVGSLGNIVPQLHIHVIGRKKTDRAWPNAIWGTSSPKAFESSRVDFWKDQFLVK
ncbi:hypothetical protein A9Q84_01545 [Halobacteriovorax marinus]|uniref:HIT domain-containing protein n=1 Tax=Halobacteriovorax marinus TaxID=97084 RepID=A0A1Y5FHQ2_9BACT|nr:hypothetical protein A9Q84_01545 [Halobacteriovorax marinus]